MVLPRTIDKARALLPGGDPGEYSISPGVSAWLLGEIGITEAEFLVLVHRAADELEVARYVEERVVPEQRDVLNALMRELRVADLGDGLRERFIALHGAQDDELVLDVLVADDRGILRSVG
jgi:hypothetical protein